MAPQNIDVVKKTRIGIQYSLDGLPRSQTGKFEPGILPFWPGRHCLDIMPAGLPKNGSDSLLEVMLSREMW